MTFQKYGELYTAFTIFKAQYQKTKTRKLIASIKKFINHLKDGFDFLGLALKSEKTELSLKSPNSRLNTWHHDASILSVSSQIKNCQKPRKFLKSYQ